MTNDRKQVPDRKTLGKAFGTTLRHFRERAEMSQDALSMEADVDRRHVGDLDRGEGNPTLEMIVHVVWPLTTLTQFFKDFEQRLGREMKDKKTH